MKIEQMTDEQLEETGLQIRKERKLIPRDNEEVTMLPSITYQEFLEKMNDLNFSPLAGWEDWEYANAFAHSLAWGDEDYWKAMLMAFRTFLRTRKINDETFDMSILLIKEKILLCMEGKSLWDR